MGYGIMPYRVPIEKLEAAIASGNEHERDVMLELHADRLEEMDENFDDDESACEDILDDLISGEINHQDQGYKYWYVIELMVQHYGRFLANNEWSPTRVSGYEFDEWRLYDLKKGFSIPHPDDFPSVFVIRHEKLDAAAEEMKKSGIDAGQISQFVLWTAAARSKGEGLVLFYY